MGLSVLIIYQLYYWSGFFNDIFFIYFKGPLIFLKDLISIVTWAMYWLIFNFVMKIFIFQWTSTKFATQFQQSTSWTTEKNY